MSSKLLDKFPTCIAVLDFFDLVKTSKLNFIRSKNSNPLPNGKRTIS